MLMRIQMLSQKITITTKNIYKVKVKGNIKTLLMTLTYVALIQKEKRMRRVGVDPEL